MRREVYHCDRCNAGPLDQPIQVWLHVGWIPDPAGGSSIRDTRGFDLCPKCAEYAFGLAAKELPTFEVAEKVANQIKRKP